MTFSLQIEDELAATAHRRAMWQGGNSLSTVQIAGSAAGNLVGDDGLEPPTLSV